MDNLLIGLHINESKVASYAGVVYLGNTFLDTRVSRQQGGRCSYTEGLNSHRNS